MAIYRLGAFFIKAQGAALKIVLGSRALETYQVDSFDLVSIRDSLTHIFRVSRYPTLRGTLLGKEDLSHAYFTPEIALISFALTLECMCRCLGIKVRRYRTNP